MTTVSTTGYDMRKMADDAVNMNHEKIEENVSILKSSLEGWREVLLPINSILMWERPYDPGILIGAITLIFGTLWYFDPSVLTTFSLLGIVACIIDYAVPTLSSNISNPEKWSGAKEKKFEDICRGIVQLWGVVESFRATILYLKDNKPKVYFVSVLIILLSFAWIGSLMDNLFLTFILSCLLVILPGLKHHGILMHYLARFTLGTSRAVHLPKTKKN